MPYNSYPATIVFTKITLEWPNILNLHIFSMETILFEDIGTVAYDAAWDYQESLLQANLKIKAKRFGTEQAIATDDETTRHHLLFCEHPHVYTIGKSGH